VAPGEIVVLTIAGASTAPRARVFGRELRAFPAEGGAWTVLVGIDLDVKPGKYTWRSTPAPTRRRTCSRSRPSSSGRGR
jgi:hypothetical protein